jgi:N-acetyl-gamma-glutamyl-phosphate reductase
MSAYMGALAFIRHPRASEDLIVRRDHAWVLACARMTVSLFDAFLVVVPIKNNLLKAAATQALQNINLAFGLDEIMGIPL